MLSIGHATRGIPSALASKQQLRVLVREFTRECTASRSRKRAAGRNKREKRASPLVSTPGSAKWMAVEVCAPDCGMSVEMSVDFTHTSTKT
ncbi:hypothetical protein F441_11930 [Phytophthora nicotianae CJ01A1]|uniref:Uncharacterized protein n=2 Tax=Phytophthora nicotianae TaxID=4792 RepID=W2WT58_PHYNI|nr:hypothetical protein L916_11606 [Phytophthora nicotianae]ETP12734.1 hypothetical protein F441_11930 [Phytophthora nicotianae CJ01A1]